MKLDRQALGVGGFYVLRRCGAGQRVACAPFGSNAAVSGRPLRSYNPASCLKGPAARGPPPRREEWRDREDWHSLHVGPEGIDRPRWEGGSERARTDTYTGCTCSPRALAQSIVQDVSRSTRMTERGTWDGRRGERGQCRPPGRRFQLPSIGPWRRFRASLSRQSCDESDDGLICVN